MILPEGGTYGCTAPGIKVEENVAHGGERNYICCNIRTNGAVHDVAGDIPIHRKSYAEIVKSR